MRRLSSSLVRRSTARGTPSILASAPPAWHWQSNGSHRGSPRKRFSTSSTIQPSNWPMPIHVYFGLGRVHDLPDILIKELQVQRPLVVTDDKLVKTPVIQEILEALGSKREASEICWSLFSDVAANPTDVNIEDGRRAFREHRADCVIAIGGGSGMDAGKSIAMVSGLGSGGSFELEQLEWTKQMPALAPGASLPPVITIPTTAGTGAELDSASMYTDTRRKVKFCVRHTELPLRTVLDPALMVSLPPRLTAWTGMDALTHALEAFFSNEPGGPFGAPMHDAIALEALRLIDLHLEAAVRDPGDLTHRSGMLVASSLAGAAFGVKGLGAVHGLSEPVGAVCNSQHGLTNAVLLPYFMRYNYRIAAAGDRLVLDDKCSRICNSLQLPYGCGAFESVLSWVLRKRAALDIPQTLAEMEVGVALKEELVEKAALNPTGGTNFPRPLTAAEYAQVFDVAHAGSTGTA